MLLLHAASLLPAALGISLEPYRTSSGLWLYESFVRANHIGHSTVCCLTRCVRKHAKHKLIRECLLLAKSISSRNGLVTQKNTQAELQPVWAGVLISPQKAFCQLAKRLSRCSDT